MPFLPRSVQHWQQAKSLENVEFLQVYSSNLANLELGCSFSLHHFGSQEEALKCLQIVVEDFGIKELRLDLRWNQLQPEKHKQLDFGYYLPFYEYAFRKNCKICLNVGPIKSFRWPEEHVPAWLVEKANLSSKKVTKVGLNSILAQEAIEFCENLMSEIKQVFGSDLEKIVSLQPENEAFNRFGHFRLELEPQYVAQIINILHQNFPKKPLLLNSAGRFNLAKMWQTVNLTSKDEFLYNQFIFGLDYYYTEPRRKQHFWRYLDPLVFSFPGDYSLERTQKLARTFGLKLEITEMQMEPWNPILEPGNSVAALRFCLLRSLKFLEKEEKKLIRLWGVEELAKNFLHKQATKEHQKMRELIRRINKC